MDRFDLGTHTRPITTASAQAQKYFNLGLNWCLGFNHEAGFQCFKKALEFDPNCAMAYWGIAYGAGPFYNLPWRQFGAAETVEVTEFCHRHIKRAQSLSAGCTRTEIALIDALAERFQKPEPVLPDEFDRWDDDYAAAMRAVYHRDVTDLDVAALFAEAMMTRTPWKLWNVKTGEPTKNADTLEALKVCEDGIAQCDRLNIQQHPAILALAYPYHRNVKHA